MFFTGLPERPRDVLVRRSLDGFVLAVEVTEVTNEADAGGGKVATWRGMLERTLDQFERRVESRSTRSTGGLAKGVEDEVSISLLLVGSSLRFLGDELRSGADTGGVAMSKARLVHEVCPATGGHAWWGDVLAGLSVASVVRADFKSQRSISAADLYIRVGQASGPDFGWLECVGESVVAWQLVNRTVAACGNAITSSVCADDVLTVPALSNAKLSVEPAKPRLHAIDQQSSQNHQTKNLVRETFSEFSFLFTFFSLLCLHFPPK